MNARARVRKVVLAALGLLALLTAVGCQRASMSATVYTAWPFDAQEAARRQEETAKALGVEKELSLDLGGGISLKLVLIPAGRFMMGSPADEPNRWPSEGPQHEVKIDRPFYMGVYEVTQAQYKAVMGVNPSGFFVGPSFPVNYVSWDAAVDFCEALSARIGRHVTLPTEAHWEFACRAGTVTAYNFGPTVSLEQANYIVSWGGNGKRGVGRFALLPVGSFAPNAFGLYDMHGNTDEWCSDRYYADAYANASPRDPAEGELERVARGGGARGDASSCRSAARGSFAQWTELTDIGFRVIVPIGEETPAPLSAADEARRLLDDARHIHHRDARGIERMTARLVALGPEAKPVLTPAIQDKDLRVYQCATAALSYLATADDVPALLEVPWRPADRDDIFWLNATSHAVVALDVVAPTAIRQLLEALKSSKPGVRQKAIELLDKVDAKVDADRLFKMATQDENQDVRWAALRMAMRRGDKRAADRAYELATKAADKDVRRGALSLALQQGDKRAVDLLISDFKADDDWYVLAVLSRDPRLVPYLIKGLEIKGGCLPFVCADALREKYADDPRVLAALPDLAARVEKTNRLEAESLESLLEKLRGPDPALACDAAAALGKLRDKRATQQLLAAAVGPDSRIRNNAFLALGQIGDESAVVPLIRLLADEKPEYNVYGSAMSALATMKAREALEPIAALATSATYPNRRGAIDALEKLGDPRALPVLEKIVRTPCDMSTRLQALYALERLRKTLSAPVPPAKGP